MNNISIFEFNSHPIRIVTLSSEPWFVAKDVLVALKSSTTVTALKALIVKDLGEEFVTNQLISDGLGRDRETMLLSEPALTLFVSRSRTKTGKQLNRWIHTEVLPSIRKTGSYSMPNQNTADEQLLSDAILMIDAAFSGLDINPALVAGVKINALAKLKPSLEPAAEESRKLLASTTTIPDRLLTATELGQQLGGISARKVNKMLIEKGLQVKNPDKKSKGSATYIPTERGHEFCDLTIATGKGKDNTSFQSLKWYPSVARVIEEG